jgi:hypothetical protein
MPATPPPSSSSLLPPLLPLLLRPDPSSLELFACFRRSASHAHSIQLDTSPSSALLQTFCSCCRVRLADVGLAAVWTCARGESCGIGSGLGSPTAATPPPFALCAVCLVREKGALTLTALIAGVGGGASSGATSPSSSSSPSRGLGGGIRALVRGARSSGSLLSLSTRTPAPVRLRRVADGARVRDPGRWCNMCGKKVLSTGIPVIWSCVEEDVDVCSACYAVQVLAGTGAGGPDALRSDAGAVFLSAHGCTLYTRRVQPQAAGADLGDFGTLASVTCSVCRRQVEPGGTVYECGPCGFSACRPCVVAYMGRWSRGLASASSPSSPSSPTSPGGGGIGGSSGSALSRSSRALLAGTQSSPSLHSPTHASAAASTAAADLAAAAAENAALRREVASVRQQLTGALEGAEVAAARAEATLARAEAAALRARLASLEGGAAAGQELRRLSDEELKEALGTAKAAVRRLKGERERRAQCVVCLSAPHAVLLLPCTHLCMCAACADRVDTCPVCRGRIDERLPVVG